MTDKGTFDGWNFTDIWIIEDDGSSYPYFQWQNNNNIPEPPQ